MSLTESVAIVLVVTWLLVCLSVLVAQIVSIIKNLLEDISKIDKVNLELCEEARGVV